MTIPCFLGIDAGTQGLTALLVKSSLSSPLVCDENKETSSLKVLAIGEGSYGFAPDLPEGCYEQDPLQWEDALLRALKTIYDSLEDDSEKPMASDIEILSICLTGQMHGCVMIDKDGKSIGTARLWCDARNQEEVCRRVSNRNLESRISFVMEILHSLPRSPSVGFLYAPF